MKGPRIKFCGNRTQEDYQLVVNSLADYIGFIFFRGSKRYVEPDVVKEWARTLPVASRQKLVGVFVNPSFEDLDYCLGLVDLDIIQLHGTESREMALNIKRTFKRKIWKAIHHGSNSLDMMRSYFEAVDGYVIDCKNDKLWGGTGQCFDWSAIPGYKKEAERQAVPYLIAGGITPTNIEQLLTYEPMGIDVASGIESDEKKSEILIRNLERKVVEKYVHIS